MTLTRNAIGNLINRYKAVLGKCRLLNTFGSLAVVAALTLGGAEMAWAERTVGWNDPEGEGVVIDGHTLVSDPIKEVMHISSLIIEQDGELEIAEGGGLTAASITNYGALKVTASNASITSPYVSLGSINEENGEENGALSISGSLTFRNLEGGDDAQQVSQNGGTVSIDKDGSLTVGTALSYYLVGGTLKNEGQITIDDNASLSQSGGTFTQSGQLDIGEQGIFEVTGGEFNNKDTLNIKSQTEASDAQQSSQTGGTITNTGTINIVEGAAFNQSDGFFENNGTFNIEEGASFSQTGGNFTNNGILDINGSIQLNGTVNQSAETSAVKIKSSLIVTGGQFENLRNGSIVIGAATTSNASLLISGNDIAFDTEEFGSKIQFQGNNSLLELSDGAMSYGKATINGHEGKNVLELGNGGTIRAESFALNPTGGTMTLQNGTLHAVGMTKGSVSINASQDVGTLVIAKNGELRLGDVHVDENGTQETPADFGTVSGNIEVNAGGTLAVQAGSWKADGTVILSGNQSKLAIGTDGTLNLTGKTVISSDVAIENAGTLAVMSTTLDDEGKGLLKVASDQFAALWETGKLLLGIDDQGNTATRATRVDVEGDATIDVTKFVAAEDLGTSATFENGKITMGDYAHLNVSGTLTIKENGELKTGNQNYEDQAGSFTAHAMKVANNLTIIGNVYIDGLPGQSVGGAIAPMDSGIVVADSGSLTVDGRLTLGDSPWRDSDTPKPVGGKIDGSLVLGPKKESELEVAKGEWTITGDTTVDAKGYASVKDGSKLTVSGNTALAGGGKLHVAENATFTTTALRLDDNSSMIVSGTATAKGATSLNGGAIIIANAGSLSLQGTASTGENGGTVYIGDSGTYPVSESGEFSTGNLNVSKSQLDGLLEHGSVVVVGTDTAQSTITLTDTTPVNIDVAKVSYAGDSGVIGMGANSVLVADTINFMDSTASEDSGPAQLCMDEKGEIRAKTAVTLTEYLELVRGSLHIVGTGNTLDGPQKQALSGADLSLLGSDLQLGERDNAATGGVIATTVKVLGGSAHVESGNWTLAADAQIDVQGGSLNISGTETAPTSLTVEKGGILRSDTPGNGIEGINVLANGTLKADKSTLMQDDLSGRTDGLEQIYVADGGVLSITSTASTDDGTMTKADRAKYVDAINGVLATGSKGLVQYDAELDEVDRTIKGNLVGPDWDNKRELRKNDTMEYAATDAVVGNYGAAAILINTGTSTDAIDTLKIKENVTLLGDAANRLIRAETAEESNPTPVAISTVEIASNKKLSLGLATEGIDAGSGTLESDVLLNEGSSIGAVNGNYIVSDIKTAKDGYGTVSAGMDGSLTAAQIGESSKAVGTVEATDGGVVSSLSTINAKKIVATKGGSVTAENPIYATFINATGEDSTVVSGQQIQAGTVNASNMGSIQGQSLTADTLNLANGSVLTAGGDLVVTNQLVNDSNNERSANGNLLAINGNIELKGGANSQGLSLMATGSTGDKGNITFFEVNDSQESSTVQSAVAGNSVIVNGTNKTVSITDKLAGNLNAGNNTVNVGPHTDKEQAASISLKGASTAGTLNLDKTSGALGNSEGDSLTADAIVLTNGSNITGKTVAANTISATGSSKLDVAALTAKAPGTDDTLNRIEKISATGGSSITVKNNPIYATFISATGANSLVEGKSVDATTLSADVGTIRGESVAATTVNLANGGTVTATDGGLVVTNTVATANGSLTLADNNANTIDLQGGATAPDLDVITRDGTVVLGGANVDSQLKSVTADTLNVNGKSLTVAGTAKADAINLFGNDTVDKLTSLVAKAVDAAVVNLKDSALTAYNNLTGTLVDDGNNKSSVTVGDGKDTATVNLAGDNTVGTLTLNRVTQGDLGDSVTARNITARNGTKLNSPGTDFTVQSDDESNPGTLTVDGSTLAVNDITADKAVASNNGSLTGNAIRATWLNADGQQSTIVGKGDVEATTVTANAGAISGARVNAATVNLTNGGTVTATGGDLVVTNTVSGANGNLTLADNNTHKIDLQGGATSPDLKVAATNGSIAFGDSTVDSSVNTVTAKALDINGKSLTASKVQANGINAHNDGLIVTKQLTTDTLQGKLTVADGAKAFVYNPGVMDDTNKTMTMANATIKVNAGGQVALGYDVTAPDAENKFLANMNESMERATAAGSTPSAVLYLDRPTTVASSGSIGVGTAATGAGSVAFADGSLLVVNGDNGSATTPYLAADGTISGLDKASLDVQHMKAGQEIRLFADGVAKESDFADGRNVTTDNRLVSATYQNGMITTGQVQAQQALPGLSGSLTALINGSSDQLGDIQSPHGGIKFLSRALNSNMVANPTEAAKAVEGAARSLAVAAVPQMAMSANTAGANAVTQRTSLAAPTSPLQGMDANGQISGTNGTIGLNSGDEMGLSAGNEYNKTGFGMWVMPLWQSSNGFGLKAGNYKMDYSGNVAGVAIGADYTIEDTVRAGITFNIGGGHSSGSGDFGETTNNMNFWGVGAYVGMLADELGLTADVNYTSSFNAIKQELPSSFAMGNLNGEVRSSAISTGLRAEYKFETEAVDIIPHVAARYTALHSDAFSMKSGGQSVMKTKATDQNLWSFPVGVTFAKKVDTGNGWYVKPSLDLTVTPTTGDVENRQKIRFTGVANKATMESQVMDRVTYGGQAGVEFGNDAIQLGLNYNLQVGEHTTNHGVFGTFRYNF